MNLSYTYDPSKVRVIPEGASGISKTSAVETGSNRTGKSSPSYHQAASKTVSRMQADNAKEHQRLKPRQLKKIMRAQLLAGNPDISVSELDKMVEEFLPIAMKAHKPPPPQKPVLDPEVAAVWKARKAERQRVVKLNKLRRKMEQPLHKEDREWIAKNKK